MEFARWFKLMEGLGLDENRTMFDSLQKAYGEKKRYYHTDKHIDSCLLQLDKVASSASNPLEVELALWFHDAIYDPYGKENERKSGMLLQQFMVKNGCKRPSIERVYKMIMATCHTEDTLTNVDESLVVDIDLSILGAPEPVYDQFEKGIREEYRWVPKFVYRKKRKEILSGFLQRDRIYQNDTFYNSLESRAKKNLQRAVNAL
jgi:predicted metal-dependent HD superfamily phosphohydrolase